MIEFNSVLKDEFFQFLQLRIATKSKSASDHDRHTLQLFDTYLCGIGSKDKNLSEEEVTGWLTTLEGKSSSKANQVIVIRIFLEQLKGYGIEPYIPPIPKVNEDYIPYIFSDIELVNIFILTDELSTGSILKNKYIHLEFPMIIRLMYGCGLRIGETLYLQMNDVNMELGVLTLRYTKGDKQRLVPMHPSLTDILKHYCMAMGIIGIPDSYLFPESTFDKALKVASARHKFEAILKHADISLLGRKKHERGPCLHCLRHVFTFKAFRNAEMEGRRVDDLVPYLSIYLGHDSLKETEKYLKFSSEMFPEAMGLFDDYTTQIFPEVNFDE